MNNFKSGGFKKGGSFGGRPSFGGNRRPEGRSDAGRPRRDDRGPKSDQEMFSATCTTCGKGCEVPFRPDGTKPVLCRECYAAKNSYDAGGIKRPERATNKFGSKPERSYGDAPQRAGTAPSIDVARLTKQMDSLEHKLNQILELMETPVSVVMEELAMVSVAKPKKAAQVMPTLVREAEEVKPAKKAVATKASATPLKKAVAKKAAKPAKAAKKPAKKAAKK